MFTPDQFKTSPDGAVMQTDPTEAGQAVGVQPDGSLGNLSLVAGRQYVACRYRALDPGTIDPALCSPGDFDGATALVEADRVIIETGPNAYIYTVNHNLTSLTKDPTFESFEGATVRCTDSPESPTFQQTQPDSTPIPIFRRVNIPSWIFGTIGGATVCKVVRILSDDTIDLATADNVIDCACSLGAFDGIQEVPFHAQPIVEFDSAPVIGQPCKLSQTLAGTLTSNFGPGELSVPFNLVAIKDYSSGAVFRAKVGINYGINAVLGSEQQRLADTVLLTGADPQLVHSIGSDFLPHEMTDTGTGPLAPIAGNSNVAAASGKYSVLTLNTKYWYERLLLPNAQLTQLRWAYYYRFKLTNPNPAVALMILELIRGQYGVALGEVVGITTDPPPAVTGNVYLYWATGGVSLYSVGVLPPTNHLLGAFDNAWHEGVIWTAKDSTIHCIHDGAAEFSAPLGPGVVADSPFLLHYGTDLDLDYSWLVSE